MQGRSGSRREALAAATTEIAEPGAVRRRSSSLRKSRPWGVGRGGEGDGALSSTTGAARRWRGRLDGTGILWTAPLPPKISTIISVPKSAVSRR